MEIVKAPNPVLSQQAKPVTNITKQILDLIAHMKRLLREAKDPEGVGLAAPQVGKSLQLFIMQPTITAPVSVFINPQVQIEAPLIEPTEKKHKQEQLEGCLSLQNIWGTVQRSSKVTVDYLDETGKKQHKIFTKFPAVIIQHEYDHLNGILFPKRVLEQKGKLYKSKKDKKGKDVFEELHV